MKKIILMNVLVGMQVYASVSEMAGRELERVQAEQAARTQAAQASASSSATLFSATTPAVPESYWDRVKNAASYLNFYQMYKNYRDSEAIAMMKEYNLSPEQLNYIVLRYPAFYAYSKDGRDAVIVFARNEQELFLKNNRLDEMLSNSIDARIQTLSEKIKELKPKTGSALSVDGLRALRNQITKLEDQQFAMLDIFQDMQKEIIKVKGRALDRLSRPLESNRSTQTMIYGAQQPDRYTSPYRSQQQSLHRTDAPAARSSFYDDADLLRREDENIARRSVVQFSR
ncbi:MAG: hypothetical protein NTZ68_03965 [Candidatus Dependentiae bacterium]|nr:hypothetical protein [Candidatus Dependentiae bacterium]